MPPNGPSASAIALIRPSGESSAFWRSFLVKPSLPLIRIDMVVVCEPSRRAAKESLELRFSFRSNDSSLIDFQATVKGCDVHSPRQGMYRYMYWPGRKFQARDTSTSTRATDPGRTSTVAVVRRLPQFLQMRIPRRPPRSRPQSIKVPRSTRCCNRFLRWYHRATNDMIARAMCK
jgi:hypothetical protein